MIKLDQDQFAEMLEKVMVKHTKGAIDGMEDRVKQKMLASSSDIIIKHLKSKEFRDSSAELLDSAIQDLKKELIEKNTYQTIVIDSASIKIEAPDTKHKALPDIIQFLTTAKQAMIVGPTGSGKSTIALNAADALGLEFGAISCNDEISKSEFIGYRDIDGNYITPDFLRMYENGGVFLIDEYDSMPASVAVVLNAAFDRTNRLSIPTRIDKPVAKKHKDFYCILAGNTWGGGSLEYSARDIQDRAFLDRFKAYKVEVDYDTNLEKAISGNDYDFFLSIRKGLKSAGINDTFSTRNMYDGKVLMKLGKSRREMFETMFNHLTQDDKDRLAKNVSF